MADFNINTFTTTAQSLANSEFGFIGTQGGVSTDGAVAVTGAGTFEVTVLGALSANGAVAISSATATAVTISVGGTGSISSGDDRAISLTASTSASIYNDGSIFGRSGALEITTTTSAATFVQNSGVIGAITGSAIDLTVATGAVQIANSGTISAAGNDATILIAASGAANIFIMNAGTISSGSLIESSISITSTGITTLRNEGVILGDIVVTSSGTTSITNSGTIQGNVTTGGGNDIFDLRDGTVTGIVSGGDGSDTYLVDSTEVIIGENPADGDLDNISTYVSFAAPAGIERLTLFGAEDIDGWLANGTNGTLTGNVGDNELFGGTANDTILSGGGQDTMSGGAGNDFYHTEGDDLLVEDDGAGLDTIILNGTATSAFVMAANIENITVNVAVSRVTGNSGSNTINASGQTGAMTIDGGGGTDTLNGTSGDTTFVTDGGDIINDAGGIDTVQSSVSFTLATGLENLVLTGSSFTGTGNSGANSITGHGGNNTLNGAGGTDALAGGGGNDLYITDGGDTLTEASNAGTDTVQSSVTHTLLTNFENLVLSGSAAINGTGNSASNAITGNGTTNSLNGLLGNDTLTGGLGNDAFIFNTTLGTTNVDRITDFTAPNDTILLENAVFTALATGTLKSTAFVRNTSGNAVDGSDRIIYETDTGKIFYDADGLGGQAKVQFATVGTNITLTNADFVVI